MNIIKTIAMYLPQFHEVPENNGWWGEGFTEWTAVRGAKRLYEGHDQPRIPQNGNYYNLLEKDTMLWQSGLMKKYSIDGICMYHYWFKEGKRILEKPAENLLKWTDIDMPFCFCWANVTWARSWSKFQNKNVWADIYEDKAGANPEGILLEQKYGREQQWKAHFEYLVPFFRDERYIKIEGKPVFLIHKPEDIYCLAEMMDYWKKLALENGLTGIYVIGLKRDEKGTSFTDAELYHQPTRSIKSNRFLSMNTYNGVRVWDYDTIWKEILEDDASEKTFFEGFVGYDDTPRRGLAGNVIEHATPEKFTYYLAELMAKSEAYGKEIVFLNAWNEWGEGMHLEPDEKHGEDYLRAIPYAKSHYSDRVETYKKLKCETRKSNDGRMEVLTDQNNKNSCYMNLLDQWMTLKEKNVFIADWLRVEGYSNVAIYGYGMLGRHLYTELLSSKVEVEYLIDQQGNKLHTECKVYLPSETLPQVDLVIVTAVYYYEEIYHKLKDKGIPQVVSLQTILYEVEDTGVR